MKKVCIFSNSHVAMLKHATDAVPPKHWKPTYFAAPHTTMGKLRLSQSKKFFFTRDLLLQKHLRLTSGGQDRAILDDYDAFFALA